MSTDAPATFFWWTYQATGRRVTLWRSPSYQAACHRSAQLNDELKAAVMTQAGAPGVLTRAMSEDDARKEMAKRRLTVETVHR